MFSSRWLLPIACLFVHATAAPQSACDLLLRVEVVEAHTHEPVSAASLLLLAATSRHAHTDSAGMVTIGQLCEGRYRLQIAADGFESYEQEISLPLTTAKLHIDLPHSSGQLLRGVVIQDARAAKLLQSRETVRTGALRDASGKTLADALQSVNGVNLLSTGGTIAKPVIHGLHSNRILILNDGVRQEDQQWGGEHAPSIDPYNAGTVTVLKGAASVRYGSDAIGGVVLVEPAALRTAPGIGGEVNLAAFSNNRMGVAEGAVDYVSAKVPSVALRLQGSVRRGGNYRIPGYWAANTALGESNYSASVAWRGAHQRLEATYTHFSNDIGIYRGAHTGSREDLLTAIASPSPTVPAEFSYALGRPRQHVEHDAVRLRYVADNRVGQWTAQYAYQHNYRQEYDVVRIDDGRAQSNLTLNTQTLNLNLDHRPWKGWNGSIGLDGMLQENFFANRDRFFLPFYNMASGAAYLLERRQFGRLRTEAGLRYDYRWYRVLNNEGPSQQVVEYEYRYSNLSGTLGASYELREGWSISATAASAWRAPQPAELFSAGLHHGAARVEIGNKALRPERALGLNLESDYRSRDERLAVQAVVYSQYIGDYIYLEPGEDLLTIRGYFKTFRYRQTDAWLNGADITASYQWTPALQTTVKASLLRARDVAAQDWLILMPSDRFSLSSRYGRKGRGRIQDWYLAAEGRYVDRQRRVPADFDAIDFPRPPAAYFLLGASAGMSLQLRSLPVHVSLTVSNALNARYREYLDAFRYFIDAPGTDVVLRVRVPFSIQAKS